MLRCKGKFQKTIRHLLLDNFETCRFGAKKKKKNVVCEPFFKGKKYTKTMIVVRVGQFAEQTSAIFVIRPTIVRKIFGEGPSEKTEKRTP